jgi:valyl-tRNA synthetase
MPPEPKIQATRWTVELETEAQKELAKQHHAFDPHLPQPVFAIDTPPPYPSGDWHIGAAAGYSLIDMIARSRRMLGYNVLFPWGLDRNGINIELVVEKKYDKRLRDWDRAEFIATCEKEIEVNSGKLEEIARRLAISADFEHRYLTDSPEYRAFTQSVFILLWEKGLVVEQLRPNNYCPVCGTTIADAEVLREARQSVLYDVKWEVVGPVGGTVVIATTRPELICAAQAVLVHPDDERYKSIHGHKLKVPVYGREVEVRPHTAVDPEYGSGALMVCSYGDQNDVQRFRELKLEPIAAINEQGRMTSAAGALEGLTVKQAREAIAKLLDEKGLIAAKRQVEQQTPICERSRSPVEIVALNEWYIKQVDQLDELRGAAHKMAFHPERHRQLLLDWIDSVTIDWPVSRRRYYHTEIPIWYCANCRDPHVPPRGPYYRPWKEKAPMVKCKACGHTEFVGEVRVFDTWMDSSNSSAWILGRYGGEFTAANWPCSIRPQGRDIVRTWLYYTTLRSLQTMGSAPFKDVLIHGMGLDAKGKAMHKSAGNVIAPGHVLGKYGSDAFRLWAASECNVGDDFRVSEERIGGAQKFLTKLHNVARFISAFPQPHKPKELHPTDAWVLGELDAVLAKVKTAYEEFSFFDAATAVRSFVWNVFAPHYLEMAKNRAYAGDPSAHYTLHHGLRAALAALASITPIMTWALWKELYGGDVHHERLPEPEGHVRHAEVGERLMAFNGEVWALRSKKNKEEGLAFNAPLSGVAVPSDLEDFSTDLKGMHKLA